MTGKKKAGKKIVLVFTIAIICLITIVIILQISGLMDLSRHGFVRPDAKSPSTNQYSPEDNSGSILILYPWVPTSPVRILPFNYSVPAAPGNNLSIRTCRGQFESATFVINAQDNVSDIRITGSDFYDAQGDKIPSTENNIRLVKVWYQAGKDNIQMTSEHDLAPELLLKDDSLVNVDYLNKVNYLKVTMNGSQQYIDISNPNGTFPLNAEIYDAKVLQPFSMEKNENKQVWMTIHIPNDTPAGDYRGRITIAPSTYAPVTLNFMVTVLPFSLEPAPLEYAIYYRGKLPSRPVAGINSEWKTPAQYTSELQDMKEHGVTYPSMFTQDLIGAGKELLLRQQIGLPEDHIYLVGIQTGNSTDKGNLKQLGTTVARWKNLTSPYGYRDMYVYGMDEVSGDQLRSERTAWNTVHQNGAKVFVAISNSLDSVNIAGDILDLPILAGPLNATQAAQWHSHGKRLFSYGNPQVGVENPWLYRKRYGFSLWNAGYDGEMDYAYQHSFGNIWNDFDDVQYRDHVFAYPTSDGVIDTVEWEGFREGVDDTRYASTLMTVTGENESAKSMISESLSKEEDAAQIRENVIDRILIAYHVYLL